MIMDASRVEIWPLRCDAMRSNGNGERTEEISVSYIRTLVSFGGSVCNNKQRTYCLRWKAPQNLLLLYITSGDISYVLHMERGRVEFEDFSKFVSKKKGS